MTLAMGSNQGQASATKLGINLDWMSDPPPPTITAYQQCIRNVDWSQTALGPMQSWRRELKQTVRFMMAETSPVILYWGKHHTIIYNEAHIPLVGKKHPAFLGMAARDAFPDFWHYFEQVMDEQQHTGLTRVGEASMLLMERHGFLEETYFDWRLTPIIGDDGTMVGGFGRPTELSSKVINSRRTACIHSLAQHISNVNYFADLWTRTMEALSQDDKDVPIAMVYSATQQSGATSSSSSLTSKFKLEATLGIPDHHRCAKKDIDIHQERNGLAPFVHKVYKDASIQSWRLIDAGLQGLFEGLEWRGFGIPAEELAFLPVEADGVVAAIIILGLNPRLKFVDSNRGYHEFIETIGNVLSPQISKLKLTEEVRNRDLLAQNALLEFQKSEVKFAQFAQRAPLGLSLANKDGKILYANEAWSAFSGIGPDEYHTSNWIDSVFEEDLHIVNEWWHRVVNLKESGTFQLRSKMPFVNGDTSIPYRTGIVAIYPDLDNDGNVATIMSLITDVSELKWNEEQLRLRQHEITESEAKYRDFAEHAPIGVVRTDARGYVQFANETWRSFYNFDRNHVFTDPQPWLTSLNKEDEPAARQYFQELSTTKDPRSIEVRLRRHKKTVEANRASPTEFWLLASGFSELNADGSIDSIVFWVTDISDQKAAEKILTDKMEEAIRLKNTQERFVDMISHEIRNPLSAILHCGEEVVDAMKACLVSTEALSPSEAVLPTDTTQHISIRNNILSALDAANTIMYCVQHQKQIVDDVLTLSKLDADLLVVSPIPVQPTELVKSALKIFEPELKASIIDLALDVGPSLEQLDIDWIMLDPNRFLQIVINLVTNAIKFTRNAHTRRIVIGVTAHEMRPPRQHGGVHYVPRRETNGNPNDKVLDNGIDQTSPEDVYLCFSVVDTGKGLSESERLVLFNRFIQASPKTHIEYGGSGLGLFISRQITEMLGGEIGVGSEPGKGAKFAFYVRTRRAKPPRRASLGVESLSVYTKTLVTPTPGTWVPGRTGQAASTPSRKPDRRPVLPTPEPTTSRRRVLVVEDNLVNQKVLCKQLRNRGFQVDAANHGQEALDALQAAKKDDNAPGFDVILCDIEMPVMDGIECVTEIRRLEKEGTFAGHIPIIGVTANVRSKQVNTAIDVGMDGVTTKPYRIDELIAHIDRVSADVKIAKKISVA